MGAETIALKPNETIIHPFLREVPPVQENTKYILEETYYNDADILKLEERYKATHLDLPALQNPDIIEIFGVIEEITGSSDMNSIKGFLDNTKDNSSRSRADLQRCGALLQIIAAIHEEAINWNTIFSKLKLNEQKEAA